MKGVILIDRRELACYSRYSRVADQTPITETTHPVGKAQQNALFPVKLRICRCQAVLLVLSGSLSLQRHDLHPSDLEYP